MEIVPVRRGSLDFLYSIRKRKKKNAMKDNRKVPWSSRRLSSLFPLGSTFPASDHPVSSFLLSHDESQGRPSIDWFPRAIDPTITFAENSGRAHQRLITISILRDLSPSKNHLLFGNFSAAVSSFSFLFLLFSFYLSFYCCCSCYVILL